MYIIIIIRNNMIKYETTEVNVILWDFVKKIYLVYIATIIWELNTCFII